MRPYLVPDPMFYVASKLFQLVFTPSNFIALMLLAGALLLAVGKWEKLARRLVVVAAILFALCGFSPLGAWLTIPLEQRFERPAVVGNVTGIILLGGYEDTSIATARRTITVNEASDRLLEAVLLLHAHPEAKLVLSGAWATLLPNDVDATASVVDFLTRSGIPRSRIVSEPRSRNTYENAVFSRRLLSPTPADRYVVVTSAYHMPRAIGAFRAAGMSVIGWPSDYRTRGWSDASSPFQFAIQGLERVDLAIREWLGLLAYWLSGRATALFPAP